MKVSWACNSCVKSQMQILFNWLTEKEAKEVKQVKKKKNAKRKRPTKK
jgi:23S rRNA maturation mini-RNase III